MVKRTLQSLQSKAWYRLMKVLFVGMFILSYVFFLAVIFESGFSTLDKENTKITCLLGNRKVFSASELELYLTASDFKNGFDYKTFFRGYNDSSILKIFNACSDSPNIKTDDIFLIQTLVDLQYNTVIAESEKTKALKSITDALSTKFLNSEKVGIVAFNAPIFSIEPVTTFAEKFTQYVIGTIIFWVVFELIRRLFYYIMLGDFDPKVATPKTG